MNKTVSKHNDELEFIEFDLTTLRDWPEFRVLTSALNAIAGRAGHERKMLQVDIEQALVALARSQVAGDCCFKCRDDDDPDWLAALCYAHKLTADGPGFRLHYRCTHGHTWTCYWSGRAFAASRS